MAFSGFFSVPARFSGRVVCRVSARGSVWAWRAPSAGQRPSPVCLFLPARFVGSARAFARCAALLGWRAQVRPGSACAVWAAGPLASSAPPWAVKVWLPAGLSAGAARAQLRATWLRVVG
jgi:hypothetical protein